MNLIAAFKVKQVKMTANKIFGVFLFINYFLILLLLKISAPASDGSAFQLPLMLKVHFVCDRRYLFMNLAQFSVNAIKIAMTLSVQKKVLSRLID